MAEEPVSQVGRGKRRVERPRSPSQSSGRGARLTGREGGKRRVERPRSPSHRLGGGSREGKPRTTGTSAPSYVQLVLRLITYSLEPCSKKRRRRDVQSAVLTVFWGGHGGEDQSRGQFTIHYRTVIRIQARLHAAAGLSYNLELFTLDALSIRIEIVEQRAHIVPCRPRRRGVGGASGRR